MVPHHASLPLHGVASAPPHHRLTGMHGAAAAAAGAAAFLLLLSLAPVEPRRLSAVHAPIPIPSTGLTTHAPRRPPGPARSQPSLLSGTARATPAVRRPQGAPVPRRGPHSALSILPLLAAALGVAAWARLRRSRYGPQTWALASRTGPLLPPRHGASQRLHALDPTAHLPDPQTLSHPLRHQTLATGVGGACQLDSCTDELFRASLPPEGPTSVQILEDAVLPLSLSLAYLYARPGVIPGAFDALVAAPIYRLQLTKLNPNQIKVVRSLGSGAFGDVYLATALVAGNKEQIVLKRAKEFGETETWMNERVNRALPGVCARLVDSFEIKPTGEKKSSSEFFGKSGERELWLAFSYEGDKNLQEYLLDPTFPFNLEALVLGAPLSGPRSVGRKLQTVRELMRQLTRLTSLIHGIGIVHRDLKPQNCIVGFDGRLRLIDLGGAADLRTGIGYYPKQFVLDQRYAAPELFVMSTTTPAPPPMAIATFFAPALWLLNTPDRFDVYSLGITFLQLCFSATRTNDAIIAFNETLKENYKYDLQAWRDDEEKRGRPDFDDGFKLLDAGNGAGWDLLKRMLQEQPGARPSATEILRSPFLKGSDLPSRAAARRQALGPRILQAVKDALGNAVREGLWGRGGGLS
jgi:serine/threonine protein kinase